MSIKEFKQRVNLDVEASELFNWHVRPGAFERLGPPWENVTLEGDAAEIHEGERQDATVSIGPFRRRWRSEITQVVVDRLFKDVQVLGPFSSWEHTHSMESVAPGRSVLEDRVEYQLPFGLLGEAFGGRYVRRQLQRLFDYRHRITKQDLARHSRTQDRGKKTVLVTGSSGLVGSALCAFLTTGGHQVRRLVRREPQGDDEYRWDPEVGTADQKAFEGVDAVVHLAGENIAARRWSDAQKERIRESRVKGTRVIVDAIRAAQDGPEVLISASAIGYYGNRGDEVLDEESPLGEGYLAEVSEAWESETRDIEGVRSVQLRLGVVLSPAGGALAKMLLPFKLGAGGRLGSGQQWMSWVALDDVVGAAHHALMHPEITGAVNVVAPEPATNAEFTKALGRVLSRPTLFPVPGFAARLAFGELADALLLGSLKVMPTRLQQSGYTYEQPTLEGALRHQLGRVAASASS